MQRDDPARLRKLGDRCGKLACLSSGNQSQRIGEGKMSFGIRVEDCDGHAVRRCGRHDHGKLIVPKTPESGGQAQAARIGKVRNPPPMRSQRFGERAFKSSRASIHHAHPLTL